MTPEQRTIHGQALLDNPVFQEANEKVNKDINRELDRVKPNDVETMKGLVMMRQGVNKYAAYIISEATNSDNKVKEFNARPKRFRF